MATTSRRKNDEAEAGAGASSPASSSKRIKVERNTSSDEKDERPVFPSAAKAIKREGQASPPPLRTAMTPAEKDEALTRLDLAVARHELVDLHTHLLGMGSADFWVSKIMLTYLPRLLSGLPKTHREPGFYSAFLELLKISKGDKRTLIIDDAEDLFKNAKCLSPDKDDKLRVKLDRMNGDEKCNFLLDYFTFDVVFSEDTLLKACGLTSPEMDEGLRRYMLETLLGNASSQTRFKDNFHEYVIFNARVGEFRLVTGLSNQSIVGLMGGTDAEVGVHTDAHVTRGLVRNWFEFLNQDGSLPTRSDLSTYRGHFTREFYPRRFTAKDSIYEQRPEVLGILLNQVVGRYDKAGVGYVELSMGSKDLLNPAIWNVLLNHTFATSLEPPEPTEENELKAAKLKRIKTEPSYDTDDDAVKAPDVPKLVNAERLCPKWRRYLVGYNEKPKGRPGLGFLMAFNRGDVLVPYADPMRPAIKGFHLGFKKPSGSLEAVQMLNQLASTYKDQLSELVEALCSWQVIECIFPKLFTGDNNTFSKIRNVLQGRQEERLQRIWRARLVGMDLVGDEMGFPYCPFVHPTSIDVVKKFRESGSKHFGVRVHAGEGMPRASSVDSHSPAQLGFELHMRILMRSIEILKDSLGSEHVRVGHAIGFLHPATPTTPFGKTLEHFHKHTLRDIVCELNPTSNHMLLLDSQAVPSPSNKRTLSAFLEKDLKVTLCTDDDGVWAIHKCANHYSHISVAHEYCEAIVRGELSSQRLERLLQNGRQGIFGLRETDSLHPHGH